MLSVLIIDRDILEYYIKYSYFLHWFEDNADVVVCAWNRNVPCSAGLEEMVPQLAETIHNVVEWNAYIIDRPFDTADYMEYDFRHNTQYSINPYERARRGKASSDGGETGEEYKSNKDDLLRLVYFLGGRTPGNITVEDLMNQDGAEAEDGYDNFSGDLDGERKYGDMYYFGAVRPERIYLITPRVFENLDIQKSFLSWEILSRRNEKKTAEPVAAFHESEFWNRYDYPANCRFLVFDMPKKESERYDDAWFLLWMSVLTLAMNTFGSDEIGAMRLYHMSINVSSEEFSQFLNKFYTHLLLAIERNDLEIETETSRLKAEMSDTSSREMPAVPPIAVTFPHVNLRDFSISDSAFGTPKDVPRLDEDIWDDFNEKADKATATLFKAAERGKREAVEAMRRSFVTELPMLCRRKLSRYDREDLEEAIKNEEYELVCIQAEKAGTRADFVKRRKYGSAGVKEFIPKRTFKRDFAVTMALGAAVYFAGFVPFLINSAKFSGWSFIIGLLLSLVPTAAVAAAAYLGLKLQRKKFGKTLTNYNITVGHAISEVKRAPESQSKYLTTLLSYMLKYQMLAKCGIDTALIDNLNDLYRASGHLEEALEQCKSIAGLCHFKLQRLYDADSLDRGMFSRGERIYLHENTRDYRIALNDIPDYLDTPFKFITGLAVIKERVYECREYNASYDKKEDD